MSTTHIQPAKQNTAITGAMVHLIASTKSLTLRAGLGNTSAVPPHGELGFSRLIAKKRTNGAMPFFYVWLSSRVLNGRRDGEAFGPAGFLFCTSRLTLSRRSPRLVAGSGLTAKRTTP